VNELKLMVIIFTLTLQANFLATHGNLVFEGIVCYVTHCVARDAYRSTIFNMVDEKTSINFLHRNGGLATKNKFIMRNGWTVIRTLFA
jgi:hypothetical protein